MKGRFDACASVADDAQLSRFVDAIAKDAGGVYEQLFVEDFREALAKRPTAAVRDLRRRCSADVEPLSIGARALMTTDLAAQSPYARWSRSVVYSTRSSEGDTTVTEPATAVQLPRHTKGKRPDFFDDPAIDQMMTFLLELTTEVGVLRDRLDTVERLLDQHGSVTRAAIESFQPSPQLEDERNAWRAAYLKRVLRMHTPD